MAEPNNLMKQMQREKQAEAIQESKRRLRRLKDEANAQISTLQLQVSAYDCLLTDLEYQETN